MKASCTVSWIVNDESGWNASGEERHWQKRGSFFFYMSINESQSSSFKLLNGFLLVTSGTISSISLLPHLPRLESWREDSFEDVSRRNLSATPSELRASLCDVPPLSLSFLGLARQRQLGTVKKCCGGIVDCRSPRPFIKARFNLACLLLFTVTKESKKKGFCRK